MPSSETPEAVTKKVMTAGNLSLSTSTAVVIEPVIVENKAMPAAANTTSLGIPKT